MVYNEICHSEVVVFRKDVYIYCSLIIEV